MLTAISRYGCRVIPNTMQLLDELTHKGQLLRGPHIAEFEDAISAMHDRRHAISTSYGRMAFYYIVKALDLPPGSEIVFPALTFWVVPELARVAGLKVVFADVRPDTFTLDPRSLEQVITERTRAVVPTHLWGLPCDMDAIGEIAHRHRLAVIEDCAHALGANWHGRPVGTLGDAGFFSFQTIKPLNTYGGGMAIVRDPGVAARVATLAAAEPWPTEQELRKKLFFGRVQRIATRPRVFRWSLFPVLWLSSWTNASPDVYLWEKIRSLDPLPNAYRQRYTNAQAALGLAGLEYLGEWTERTRAHARAMDRRLAGIPGVQLPVVPPDREHVYYQYCAYGPTRDAVVRSCVRRGVDIETLHVDLCSELDLFADARAFMPGARRAIEAVQLPVYESLTDTQIARVGEVVADAFRRHFGAQRLVPVRQ